LNCQFTRLEQEALLHITGADTLKFLQGQTTCDTRNVDLEHAIPGVYCTPGGRVVCDFLLCQLGPEHFALRLRREIRAAASKTFGKYIVFSKATLEDSREDWVVVGVWGEGAAPALDGIFGPPPGARFGAHASEAFVLVRTDDRGERFECYLNESSAGDYLACLADAMPRGAEADWQAGEIIGGVARIEAATVEAHVPQTLNYDLTGHISFNKGCYTGQEVVARLHYRGKPKHRACLAELPAGTRCAAGAPVFDAGSGHKAGSIVNAAETSAGTIALVETAVAERSDSLRLGAADGVPLTLGELPYALQGD